MLVIETELALPWATPHTSSPLAEALRSWADVPGITVLHRTSALIWMPQAMVVAEIAPASDGHLDAAARAEAHLRDVREVHVATDIDPGWPYFLVIQLPDDQAEGTRIHLGGGAYAVPLTNGDPPPLLAYFRELTKLKKTWTTDHIEQIFPALDLPVRPPNRKALLNQGFLDRPPPPTPKPPTLERPPTRHAKRRRSVTRSPRMRRHKRNPISGFWLVAVVIIAAILAMSGTVTLTDRPTTHSGVANTDPSPTPRPTIPNPPPCLPFQGC